MVWHAGRERRKMMTFIKCVNIYDYCTYTCIMNCVCAFVNGGGDSECPICVWMSVFGRTYVVINAFCWRWTRVHNVIVVSMIDQEQTAGLNAPFEILYSQLLFTLISECVQHVSKWISQANDRIETVTNQMIDIIIDGKPIGLFDNCAIIFLKKIVI